MAERKQMVKFPTLLASASPATAINFEVPNLSRGARVGAQTQLGRAKDDRRGYHHWTQHSRLFEQGLSRWIRASQVFMNTAERPAQKDRCVFPEA